MARRNAGVGVANAKAGHRDAVETACHNALISLGSNLDGPLGTPADYICAALSALDDAPGIHLVRCSSFYQSEPWGRTDQASFTNAVAELHCNVSPESLLATLLETEGALGRVRAEKWGPRMIDLDLLVFDDVTMHSESLVLPHPHMHERAFVLVPLLELHPGFVIPGKGPASDCLDAIAENQGIERI